MYSIQNQTFQALQYSRDMHMQCQNLSTTKVSIMPCRARSNVWSHEIINQQNESVHTSLYTAYCYFSAHSPPANLRRVSYYASTRERRRQMCFVLHHWRTRKAHQPSFRNAFRDAVRNAFEYVFRYEFRDAFGCVSDIL